MVMTWLRSRALVLCELALAVVTGPQLALDLTAERRHGTRRRDRLRGSADADEDVDAAVTFRGRDRSRDIAVADQGDAGARRPYLAHVVLVAGAIEDHGGDVGDVLALGLGDPGEVVGHRGLDVDDAGGLFAHCDLVHVHQLARGVHRPASWRRQSPLGRPACPERSGGSRRRDRRRRRQAGELPVADTLAVEQHWGFVLLALADDDDAVHVDGRQHGAHGIDRGLINLVLVAAALVASRRDGRHLGDVNELERGTLRT